MPSSGYLIPAKVNTHGLTDDPMLVLDTRDLQAALLVYSALHERHWRKQGKPHSRRGGGGWACVAGDVLGMLVETASDLPLHHRLPQ